MTAVMTPAQKTAAVPAIGPADVREVLGRSILADGLEFVLDIERSAGSNDAGRTPPKRSRMPPSIREPRMHTSRYLCKPIRSTSRCTTEAAAWLP